MPHLDLIPDPSVVLSEALKQWLAVADKVSVLLRGDIVPRDRANELPRAQVALLREHGLLDLSVPARFGGKGVGWNTALQVVRRIARTDAPIAQLLGYHYAWLRIIEVIDSKVAQQALRDTVAHAWLWAGSGTSRTSLAQFSPEPGGGYVANADAGFATGAPVADRLLVRGADTETQQFVVAIVEAKSPRVKITDDWDVLGQRQSASRSVRLDALPVAASQLLGVFGPVTEPPPPALSLGVLFFQLLFAHLHLGIAEGGLLEAAAYTRTRAKPWVHSGLEQTTQDPFVQNGYGQHLARLQSVSALAERADAALSWAVANRAELTGAERTQVAEIVASAKVVSIQFGLEVTGGLFDLTGARSTAASFGLDRFWRNLRTMSLHDPLAYKLNELGRFFLNGDSPVPSGYR